MHITINENEAQALILIRRWLWEAITPVPEFLNWTADRLTKVHGESGVVDYVQTLRSHAATIRQISDILGPRS